MPRLDAGSSSLLMEMDNGLRFANLLLPEVAHEYPANNTNTLKENLSCNDPALFFFLLMGHRAHRVESKR